MRKLLSRKGFTLIELLLVISIIVIVIAVGSVSYSTARKTARNAQRQTDLQKIAAALEEYHADHGKYPDTGHTSGSPEGKFETAGRSGNDQIRCLLGVISPPVDNTSTGGFNCADPLNTYIANGEAEKLPIDPLYSGTYTIHDPIANYAYATKNKGQGYILVTRHYEGQAPAEHRFTSTTSSYYWGLAGSSPWPLQLQDGNQYFLTSPTY